MKRFTPELLERFGSVDDKIADAASEEWERTHQAYVTHLKSIRPQLPRPLRQMLRRFCLHDAKVLTLAHDERPFFSIFLKIDKPSDPLDRFLELNYRLARAPKFVRPKSTQQGEKPFGWWLYDEVDVLKEEPVPVFLHSILFTGGWELQLFFFDMTYSRLRKILFPKDDLDEECQIEELEDDSTMAGLMKDCSR